MSTVLPTAEALAAQRIHSGDIVTIGGELQWILDIYDDVTFHATNVDGEVMQFSVYDIESIKSNVPTNRLKELVRETFSQVYGE
jgi:hypothetical protein